MSRSKFNLEVNFVQALYICSWILDSADEGALDSFRKSKIKVVQSYTQEFESLKVG